MQVLSKEKTGEFSKLWGLRIKTNFKRGLKNFKFQQNLVFGWPGRKKTISYNCYQKWKMEVIIPHKKFFSSTKNVVKQYHNT